MPSNAGHDLEHEHQPVLCDGEVELVAVPADRGAFVVRWRGEQVGRVELVEDGDGAADLLWLVVPEHQETGTVECALRLAVDWGFDALHLERVEARVLATDLPALRSVARAGLRREGVARGVRDVTGGRSDTVLFGRLRDDAPPQSREGFIALLNSTLPTKRAIAQGVVRDPEGRILLCELTYKREWDLPGGVVDPSESPAACVEREIREELGVDLPAQRLLAVNWLPPWRGWADATAFIFDLGVAGPDLADRLVLEPRELRAVHWVAEEDLEPRVAPYNQRLLAFLATHDGPTAYLEDGLPAL